MRILGLGMPNLQNIAKAYEIETCEINNHNEMKEKFLMFLNQRNLFCVMSKSILIKK